MGDLAERDPRASWPIDRIVQRTIMLRKLQRELRGHDEREEFKGLSTLAPELADDTS